MTEREKKCLKFVSELLEMYEFDIYATKGSEGELVFKLSDLQGANLGNIDEDEFTNLAQVIGRLEVYHNDYIFEPIDEGDYDKEDAGINEFAVYLESDRVAKTLEQITPRKIQEDIAEEYFISFK